MKIGTPKEVLEGEARVAMTPDSARQLQKLGHECIIETGAGIRAGFIHVPAHHEIGTELNVSSWSQDDINKAVGIILGNI